MKQWAKTIVYESLAALLTVWAILRCTALCGADLLALQNSLHSAEWTLLILACVWIGTAIYIKRSHVRQHADLRADVWFGLAVGAVQMILWIVFFWTYGGLSSVIDVSGLRARNFLIVCMSGLPLPFAVRAAILAFFSQDEHRTRRLILSGIAAALLVAYVVLMLCGSLMSTLPVPSAKLR